MKCRVKRIGIQTLVILFFLPLLAGCWDSNDIEARSNVLALAIDRADPETEQEDDDITISDEPPHEELLRVTAQVAIPGEVPLGPGMAEEGGGEEEPVWVLNVEGYSLHDAMSRLQQEIAEELFLGHLRVIVVHEDVAKEGVDRFNEALLRDPDVRRTAWMVVSQEDEEAAQYMDLAPALEDIPTLYLANMVENSAELGKFPENSLALFWRMLSSQGQDGFLPYLRIMEDEQIQINGLAYFQDDQMIGDIDPINIGTFMALTDEEEGGYEFFSIVPGTDAHVLNQTDMRETNINTDIRDGKPHAHVTARYELVINETTDDNAQLLDDQVIENIEKAARKENTYAAEQLIQELQEEKSDIFGFGEHIRAKHPGYWNQHVGSKEQWRDVFQDMDIDVDYIIRIRRVGTQAT